VAQALGFPLSSGTRSLDRIAASIQQRRILLVLDNCEHLIQAAAEITETLLHAGLHLKVLATSREALRAEGEYVYRVPSLEVPREDVSDPAAIMRCGALQLFEARTSSALVDGVANPGLAVLKALICRRLDGIPLAIELAAARVRLMGLRSVAEGRLRLPLYSASVAGRSASSVVSFYAMGGPLRWVSAPLISLSYSLRPMARW